MPLIYPVSQPLPIAASPAGYPPRQQSRLRGHSSSNSSTGSNVYSSRDSVTSVASVTSSSSPSAAFSSPSSRSRTASATALPVPEDFLSSLSISGGGANQGAGAGAGAAFAHTGDDADLPDSAPKPGSIGSARVAGPVISEGSLPLSIDSAP